MLLTLAIISIKNSALPAACYYSSHFKKVARIITAFRPKIIIKKTCFNHRNRNPITQVQRGVLAFGIYGVVFVRLLPVGRSIAASDGSAYKFFEKRF